MIRNTLLAAAAVATLATGTIAAPSHADAGFNITIGNYGQGYGYGSGGYYGGSRWYIHGYRPGRYYGGSRWYGSDHGYRSYRPHCRWKVKKVRVRYWDAYNNCWVNKKVRRRYRICY